MSVLVKKESRSGHITSAYLPVELVISANDFSRARKSPIQAFCRGNMSTHEEDEGVNQVHLLMHLGDRHLQDSASSDSDKSCEGVACFTAFDQLRKLVTPPAAKS